MAGAAPERPLRVAFATLGCRLNQFDTEAMKEAVGGAGGDARLAGWDVVPWASEADVYVINSCTVTARADQKCRQLARAIRRRRPAARVVVTGCYAQTQPARVAAIEGVDAVVGNPDKDDPGAWLTALPAAAPPLVRVTPFGARAPLADAPLERFAGHSRAFVKIQDGCDLRCAYCVIWRARGPARSRPPAQVLAQARSLHAAGFHELVLTGVNLGSYGRDLGAQATLAGLVAELLARLPDLRLRLSSLHPDELTPALLAEFVRHGPRLRPHLHLSLQSGSDAVLRRMRRPYTTDAARAAVAAYAAAVPAAGLGADIIVGYPGETAADFAATRALLTELPFTYLHVFRFSPRPGTPAAALDEPVPAAVAGERAAALRRLSRRQRAAFESSLAGSWREAVVEDGAAPAGWRTATTDNYATVLVPDRVRAGALVRVRLARLGAGALRADAVEPLSPSAAGPDPAPER